VQQVPHRLELEEHVECALEVSAYEVELICAQAVDSHSGCAANLVQALLHLVAPHIHQLGQLVTHLHVFNMGGGARGLWVG
jgi:hypothetical protein